MSISSLNLSVNHLPNSNDPGRWRRASNVLLLHPDLFLEPPASHQLYRNLRDEVFKEFDPQTADEIACVQQLALARWKEHRLDCLFNRALQLRHQPGFARLWIAIDHGLASNLGDYMFFFAEFKRLKANRSGELEPAQPPQT